MAPRHWIRLHRACVCARTGVLYLVYFELVVDVAPSDDDADTALCAVGQLLGRDAVQRRVQEACDDCLRCDDGHHSAVTRGLLMRLLRQ